MDACKGSHPVALKVAKKLEVIKLAVPQMDRLMAWKQFRDGLDGVLGLLQMASKG